MSDYCFMTCTGCNAQSLRHKLAPSKFTCTSCEVISLRAQLVAAEELARAVESWMESEEGSDDDQAKQVFVLRDLRLFRALVPRKEDT